jgi:glycosyltransferase involved in cell wall biosynthesis
LICTYNAEKFIDATLLSVLHQTYQNQEILIYDDKSSDATMLVLKKYQETYPQIKVFTAETKL